MYLDVEYFLNKNMSFQVSLFETRDGVCVLYLSMCNWVRFGWVEAAMGTRR